MGHRSKRRMFVLGLDCAEPKLVFDLWKDHLPVLKNLAARGCWGKLRSSTPAITVPAWSSMLSSRDPGVLGVYGFRNRADTSYYRMEIADNSVIHQPRVWDYLGDAGYDSILIGIPQTYPVRSVRGRLVSGILTPDIEKPCTWPQEWRDEIRRLAPQYDFDARPFRTERKDWLLEKIHSMTEAHFTVADSILDSPDWDFFMLVEIGLDRMHHGFWNYFDPTHFEYEPGNPYEKVIFDYYVWMDTKLGEWLDRLSPEDVVLVVSDHGAHAVQGWICINEWLWREGYLTLFEEPQGGVVPFTKVEVDWSRTRAWGAGGYYGRIFFNIEGREPEGVVKPEMVEDLREELCERIAAVPSHTGEPLDTRVYTPDRIYQQVNGLPPDLLVYFDNLRWRSAGSFGHDGIYSFKNDTGPDGCNHAEDGLFILYDPAALQGGREVIGAQLMDVAPWILDTFGVSRPDSLQGKSMIFE
ncbi:MAG: alkaline phosphatase family protein [Anaerolineales bacterium]|nr:alkaline phosphatase family protein [Anaerolineales bacterium]